MKKERVLSSTDKAPLAKYLFPQHVSSYLMEQIKFADQKAAWTFSILSVGTAALLTRLGKLDWNLESVYRTLTLLVISVFLIIFAFKHVVRVMYPRIRKGNKQGLVYFGDILSYHKKDYISKTSSMSEDEIISAMHANSYNLSEVVDEKFRALRTAIITSAIALVWVIIVVIISIF